MRNVRRLRPSPALVISTIALFVAIGGISWAAATIGTNDIKNNAVTAKKLHKKAVTTKKIKNKAVSGAKISGDQRTLWAAVQSNGTIADQSGGITVTAHGGGSYEINFGKNVSGRALMATGINGRVIADAILCNGGTGVGTDCSSQSAPNDSEHVFVNTSLAATAPATFTNLPFYVAALPQ